MNTSDSTQLSLFEQSQDNRPLPLLVAEKWDFNLTYHVGNDGTYMYCARDWFVELGGKASNWSRDKSDWLSFSNQSKKPELIVLDVKRERRPIENLEFVTDKGLYSIAQRMYEKDGNKVSAVRSEILDYLSASGAFVDAIRRDPEQMEALAAVKRKREIDKYERAGLADRMEVRRLKDRDANIEVFKSLKATITKVCENPHFGRLINAEYLAMFGEVASTLQIILNTKNVRDGLQSLQLTYLTAAERSLQAILEHHKHMTNGQIESAIQDAITPLGATLKNLCNSLGIHPITGKPLLESGIQHD